MFAETSYCRQCFHKETENIVGFGALNLDLIFEVENFFDLGRAPIDESWRGCPKLLFLHNTLIRFYRYHKISMHNM